MRPGLFDSKEDVMSDGLTDGYRSSLDAERRRMLLRSVAASLVDGDDRSKTVDAANDIMFYQASFYAVDPAQDREAQAVVFLDRLRAGDKASWARLMVFAIKNPDSYGGDGFQALKDLSPFKGRTLVTAKSDVHDLRLVRQADIECTIARQAGPSGNKLYVLDLAVLEDFSLEP